ncbi:hypothetical protein V8F33_009026 [Rhypophila sp. PSN 637]
MSFVKESLTKDENFFSDAVSCPTNIEGSGQMVYWMKCWILVYKAGDTKNHVDQYPTCDGQGKVDRGTWLIFMGRDGKVKEVV